MHGIDLTLSNVLDSGSLFRGSLFLFHFLNFLERQIIQNSKPHSFSLVHSLGIDLSLDLFFYFFPVSPGGGFLEGNQFSWLLPKFFLSVSPFLHLSQSLIFSSSWQDRWLKIWNHHNFDHLSTVWGLIWHSNVLEWYSPGEQTIRMNIKEV